MSLMTAFLVLAASSCCSALLQSARATARATAYPSHRTRLSTVHAMSSSAPGTPEELLLKCVELMRDNEMEKARFSLTQAQRLCDSNGGPTEEQAALLELLGSRLPMPVVEKEPSLDEMFPGTTAAPTGASLVLPGTPSMAELAAKAREKRQAAADAASRNGGSDGGPRMSVATTVRRATIASIGVLPLAALTSAANAETELQVFDYLSPARFAVKKQRQKQERCFDAGECVDETPYYAIECQRGDTECQQRKRRLASQEFENFKTDPTSSPIFLLAASAVIFQWGSAAVRIGAGVLRRARGDASDD